MYNSMYTKWYALDRSQKIFISSLHAVCFVVLPKNFFGLYGGHWGRWGHRGQKISKNKYVSKCLELSNSSRNPIKNFDRTVRPHSAGVRTAQCGQNVQFDVRKNVSEKVVPPFFAPNMSFTKMCYIGNTNQVFFWQKWKKFCWMQVLSSLALWLYYT